MQAEQLTLVNPDLFPLEMLSTPYWLLWQPTWSESRNKYIKTPLHKAWQTQRHIFQELPPVKPGQGYGYIYAADHPYICIDVDDGSPLNFRLVDRLKSYAEWSPSGQGAHVIIKTDNKQALIDAFGTAAHNSQEKRDLYISSGYVTITGQALPLFVSSTVRHIPHKELIEILSPYFSMQTRQNNQVLTFPASKAKQQDFPAALVYKALLALPVQYLPSNAFIDFPVIDTDVDPPPEAREAWLTVGQALHNLDGGSLNSLDTWVKWSASGNKFDEDALLATWRSFKDVPSNITFATVLKLYTAQRPQYIDFRGDPPVPTATLDNIKAYISYAKITGRYNTVTNNIEITMPQKLKNIINSNDPKMVSFLVDSEMMKHGTRDGAVRPKARSLLVTMAAENIYNPIVEHFTSVLKPWDGRSRIPDLMDTIDCQKSDLKQYTFYVRKWLIQVMAAVFTTAERPNRLNNVLILQGEQGAGKTMWVEALFPPALQKYCVGSKSVNMSQFRNDMVKLGMELTNTLICNINEIDTVFSPKTYSEFKQFLDKTVDKVVLPYGAASTDVLRRTVFIGSTNRYQLFSDTTGNRRFMLIDARSFNFKHSIDLNQLWAEAYHYYKQGESWWLDDNDVVAQQRLANINALDTMNEEVVDKLNNMFDSSKPDNWMTWETYTFPRIVTLLGLTFGRNSREHKIVKQTIAQWLSQIAPNAPLVKQPKNQGTPWTCRVPPLKLEV